MRFLEVSIGTEDITLMDIAFDGGRTEDDGRNHLAMRMLPKPAKNVVAVHSRHLEVAQQNVWERKGIAVGITAIALEVGDGFGAVEHVLQLIGQAGGFEGAL